jgi:hypothetical protein
MTESKALSALLGLLARIDDEAAAIAWEIERFLSGQSDGSVLLHALYGGAAEEPVPERLLAVLREADDGTPPLASAAAS